MSNSDLYWEERHLINDDEDAAAGFFGSISYIFKTNGEHYGTPVIETGWECMLVKEKRIFIMWNCSEETAKRAVEGFVTGELAVDLFD